MFLGIEVEISLLLAGAVGRDAVTWNGMSYWGSRKRMWFLLVSQTRMDAHRTDTRGNRRDPSWVHLVSLLRQYFTFPFSLYPFPFFFSHKFSSRLKVEATKLLEGPINKPKGIVGIWKSSFWEEGIIILVYMLKLSQKQDKQKHIFILTLTHGSGAQTT